MATKEELGVALKNAHAAGDTAAATKLAAAYKAAEGPGVLKSAVEYAKNTALDAPTALTTGFGKFGSMLLSPAYAANDLYKGQDIGTTYKSQTGSISDFGREHARDSDSLAYKVIESLPEIVGTGAGIAGAGRQIAARALPRVLGRAAPVVGDILANSGYEAGKAALAGEDAGKAALYGAAGSAAGHGVATAVGGVKSMLPQAQRQFMERGGVPTVGQMMGGPVASAEKAVAKLPFIGQISGVTGTLDDAGRTFSTADTNRALEHIGGRTRLSGEHAVDDAIRQVDAVYERTIPHTRLKTSGARNAVNDAVSSVIGGQTPTAAARRAQVIDIINAETDTLTRTGAFPTGRAVKDVDTRLGELQRRYANDPQIADAIRLTKQNLRANLEPTRGAPPGVVQDLQRANRARAELYALEDAATSAAGKTGHFSPTQSFQARANQAGGRAPRDDAMNYFLREQEQLRTGVLPTAGGLAGLGLGASLVTSPRVVRRGFAEGAAGVLPRDSVVRRRLQSRGFAQGVGQEGRILNREEEEE